MGLKAATQPGVAYKPPELPKEHQHLLHELPQKYIQTELLPEEGNVTQKRPELSRTEEPSNPPKSYLKGDLESLEQTEHFEANLIKHIFNGGTSPLRQAKGKGGWKRQVTTPR